MTDSSNLDLVRSIYSGWEQGDFSRTDWAAPDIEYIVVDGLSPGRWEGLEAMGNAASAIFMEGWEGVRAVPDEYRALDDERVLALVTHVGRGKRSRIEMAGSQTETAHLFRLRGGKVISLVIYWDRDRAFADLGLKE